MKKRNTVWREFLTEQEYRIVEHLEEYLSEARLRMKDATNELRIIRNRCCTRQNRA